MALTLTSAINLLKEHDLLREIIQADRWSLDPTDFTEPAKAFSMITYDSRQVEAGGLLFCKGNFKGSFLEDCDAKGMSAYVSQNDYSSDTNAVGIIVNDVYAAMSLLSAAFYDYPQREMTLIGITGTKGKTTTAYYVQAILNAYSSGKAALFSSVDNCLDGTTYRESNLTTPESLDSMRMMREAANNGMKYLVMEVSSQAYKVGRVYGLTFDVGAFLNISPDHISPIEHPTFEDYLYCKRQIVRNSRRLVLGADCDHAGLIMQDAADAGIPVRTFALRHPLSGPHSGAEPVQSARADFTATPIPGRNQEFTVDADGLEPIRLRLSMPGEFNYSNATAALCIADLVGVDITNQSLTKAVEPVTVSGRMEMFEDGHGDDRGLRGRHDDDTVAIVDFAHNYTSVKAVVNFALQRFKKRRPHLTLVTGSVGDKAYDRRKEIIEAAQDEVDEIILTSDDTNTEPAEEVCAQMQGYITNPDVCSRIILDRASAVRTAVEEARERGGFNVLLIVGKGDERWIKVAGRHVPYEGDEAIIKRMFA